MNQKEFIKSRINCYSKTEMGTYSWGWLLKTVGTAVVGNLIGSVFKKAKFALSSDEKLFNETLEKFRKSKNVDDCNKYHNMLMRQLNKASNKDEVKDDLKKAEEDVKSKGYSVIETYSLDPIKSELNSIVDSLGYDKDASDAIKSKITSSDRDALISMLDEEIKSGEGDDKYKDVIEKFKSIRTELSTNSKSSDQWRAIASELIEILSDYKLTQFDANPIGNAGLHIVCNATYDDWMKVCNDEEFGKRVDKVIPNMAWTITNSDPKVGNNKVVLFIMDK